MKLGPTLRSVAGALLVLVVVIAAWLARMVVEGERAMGASDIAFDAGDVKTALIHARRAALLHAPGAPHLPAARARLLAIARGAEAAGDVEAALLAWRTLRGVEVETRSFLSSDEEVLRTANANLARLGATGATPEAVAVEQRQLQSLLDREQGPRTVWVAVLGASSSIIVLGLAALVTRGFDARGTPQRTWFAAASVSVVVGTVGLLLSILWV